MKEGVNKLRQMQQQESDEQQKAQTAKRSFLDVSADSVCPAIMVTCVFTTVSNSNLTLMNSVQIQSTVYTVSLTTTRAREQKESELHRALRRAAKHKHVFMKHSLPICSN